MCEDVTRPVLLCLSSYSLPICALAAALGARLTPAPGLPLIVTPWEPLPVGAKERGLGVGCRGTHGATFHSGAWLAWCSSGRFPKVSSSFCSVTRVSRTGWDGRRKILSPTGSTRKAQGCPGHLVAPEQLVGASGEGLAFHRHSWVSQDLKAINHVELRQLIKSQKVTKDCPRGVLPCVSLENDSFRFPLHCPVSSFLCRRAAQGHR